MDIERPNGLNATHNFEGAASVNAVKKDSAITAF